MPNKSLSSVDDVVKNLIDIRALVIKEAPSPKDAVFTTDDKDYKSKVEKTGPGKVIRPTYDPTLLMNIVAESTILPACVSCMMVNVDGFGYTLDNVAPVGTSKNKVEKEKALIRKFLGYINYDESLTSLRMKLRQDLETVGFGGWEFIKDGTGGLAEVNWIPAKYLKMTDLDEDYTDFEQAVVVDGLVSNVKRRKRFRRFVWQSKGKKISSFSTKDSVDIYYKELGDPRSISNKTGKVDNALAPDNPDYATEVHLFRLIEDGGDYPVPRWLGTLLSAVGSRRAEALNYKYFRNNMFVPLAILVSGGVLTQDSIKRLEQQLKRSRGDETPWEALILEAFPQGADDRLVEEGRSTGLRLEIKSLIETVKDDMLFREYDISSRNKQRVSFRIPKILIGESEDYNRASAEAALSVVNAQVFDVERDEFDDFMNRKVFPLKGFKYHRFRSLSYRASDPEVLSNVLYKLSQTGVVCPATARETASKILGVDIPLPDADWIQLPFPLVQSMVQMMLIDKPELAGELTVPDAFQGKVVKFSEQLRLFLMGTKLVEDPDKLEEE